MESTNQSGIISTRIKQLQSSILHSYPNEELSLPDITIHAIDVDDTGCVWFTIIRSGEHKKLREKSFYVSLNFFKKALPFFLNISGVANFITNKNEIRQLPRFVRSNVTEDRLLVCVKIMNAEYFEQEQLDDQNWVQKCKNIFASVFVNEEYPLVLINDSNALA